MESVQKVNGKTVVVNDEGEQQKHIKLSFFDEHYSVYERNGSKCVRCDLACSLNFKNFNSYCSKFDYYGIKFDPTPALKKHSPGLYGLDENGSFCVSAHSKCISTDTFDEETGRHIAQSRAKAKAYAKASKIMKEIVSEMEKTVSLINSSIVFYDAMSANESNHVNNDLIK